MGLNILELDVAGYRLSDLPERGISDGRLLQDSSSRQHHLSYVQLSHTSRYI